MSGNIYSIITILPQQVASRALSLPPERIYISESSTALVPNTSPTAASMGSDLNGMAVMDACAKITARLAPLKKQHPQDSWEELVSWSAGVFSYVLCNVSMVGRLVYKGQPLGCGMVSALHCFRACPAV